MWTLSQQILLCVISFFMLNSCGPIGLGSGNFDDAVPNGTIKANGTFTGGDITGSVFVYQLDNGSHIIRLESFSISTTAGFLLIAETNSAEVLRTTLRGNSGNLNYTTNVTGNPTWSSVKIENSFNTVVSTAVLNNCLLYTSPSPRDS